MGRRRAESPGCSTEVPSLSAPSGEVLGEGPRALSARQPGWEGRQCYFQPWDVAAGRRVTQVLGLCLVLSPVQGHPKQAGVGGLAQLWHETPDFVTQVPLG